MFSVLKYRRQSEFLDCLFLFSGVREPQEIHLNITLDTLINTFNNYVKELRDRKLLKKGCYEKALSLAFELLSIWFTDEITRVQDFVTRLREDLFPKKSRQNA